MPSKCFVSGCRSNYNSSLKVRVFNFPRDEALRILWVEAVQREDKREPSKASKICEQHFKTCDIITEATGFDSKTREVIRVPLQKHRLKPDAVPSIFEGLTPKRKRKCISQSPNLADSCIKEGSQDSIPDIGHNFYFTPLSGYMSNTSMRRCVVPGCRTNYVKPYISVFKFPQSQGFRDLWLKKIGCPFLKVTDNTAVCYKHFEKDCIIEIDGSHKKLGIKPGSVPTIFFNEDDSSNNSNDADVTTKNNLDEVAYKMQNRRSSSASASDTSKELDEESADSPSSEADMSPTTNRPFISILKPEGMEDEKISNKGAKEKTSSPRKTTPGKSSPVKRSNSNRSNSNALPSPYKHFPTVTVYLKEEDRLNAQRELGKSTKRPSLSSSNSSNEVKLPTKRRKVEKPTPTVLGRINDCFCWVCHRENIHLTCITCPRAFHQKCSGEYEALTDWVCPECKRIVAAETEDTRSTVLSQISLDKLHTLLRFCLIKMRQRAGVAFHQPVSLDHYPKYLHYVIHPMDFSLLEKKIKQKAYGCTEAFLADVKWILHNSCVFNGSQHPLSTNAKSIVKTCDNDMQEIEVCPDCFCHSIVRNKYWFSEVCRKPHPLVWAKLKGFPYWPAKVVRIADGNVDARFFGAHDRAWVPIIQCYHLSKEMPTTSKPKKKGNYETALDELNAHVQLLIQKFGVFEYAPYRTVFDPDNVYCMYHGIDIDKISQEEIPFSMPVNINSNVENSSEFEKRLSVESNEDDQSKNSTETETTPLPKADTDAVKDTQQSNLSDASPSVQPESIETRKKAESETDVLPELDSSQLNKIERALQRIKGYVSVNSDAEKDSEPKEKVSDVKESTISNSEENSAKKEESGFLADLIKTKPMPPTIDIPNIEEETQKDSTPILDTTKKNDLFSLKLIETIESCKAKLGLSGSSDLLEKSSTDSESMEEEDDDGEEDEELEKENKEHSGGEAKREEHGNGEEFNKDKTDVSEEEESSDESSSETDDDSNSVSSNTDIETVEDIDESSHKHVEKEKAPDKNIVTEDKEENNTLKNDNSDSLNDESSLQIGTPEGTKDSEALVRSKVAPENFSSTISSGKSIIGSGSCVTIRTDLDGKCETGQQSSTPSPNTFQSSESPSVVQNNTDAQKTTSKEGGKQTNTESVEFMDVDVEIHPVSTDKTPGNPTKNLEMEEDEDIYICIPPKAPTPPLICLDDGSETEPEISHKAEANVNQSSSVAKSHLPSKYLPEPESKISEQNTDKYALLLAQAKLIPTNARKSIKRPIRPPSIGESSDEEENGPVPVVKKILLTGAKRTFQLRQNKASQLSSSPKSNKSSERAAFSILSEEVLESSDNEQGVSAEESSQNVTPEASSNMEEKNLEIVKLKKKLSCLFSAVQLQYWKHNQEKIELRHNMNQILLEMRAALEADKKMATESIVRKLEAEKNAALDDAKKKQWCAFCHQESRYGCCWNTSYCSISCQKRHFLEHRKTCTQVKSKSTEGDLSGIKPKLSSPSIINDGKDGKKLILLNVVPKQPDAKSSLVTHQDSSIHKIAISKVINPQTPLHLVSSSAAPSTHSVKFMLAPMKTNSSSSHLETTLPTFSSSDPFELRNDTSKKVILQTNVSSSKEMMSQTCRSKSSTPSTSKEKLQEPSLEEIYFPSPPAVNFEGLDTALPDKNVQFDNIGDSSDTDDASQSAGEDVAAIDNVSSSDTVNLGRGIEIKSKIMNQCLVYGKTKETFTRCLVDVLFPNQKLLATCSVFSKSSSLESNVTNSDIITLTRAGLPLKKVNAIIDTVIKKFPEATRSEIALAINAKCKEAREKVGKMENVGKLKKFENSPSVEQKQGADLENPTPKKATITVLRNISSNPDLKPKTTTATLSLTVTTKSIPNRLIKPAATNILRCYPPPVLIRPRPSTTSPTITSIKPASTTNIFTNKMPPQIPLPSMQKNTTVRALLPPKNINDKNPKADLTKIVFPMDILKKTPLTPAIQRSPFAQPYVYGSPTSAQSQPTVSKPEPAST